MLRFALKLSMAEHCALSKYQAAHAHFLLVIILGLLPTKPTQECSI